MCEYTWPCNVLPSCGKLRHHWDRSSWPCHRTSQTWGGSPDQLGLMGRLFSERFKTLFVKFKLYSFSQIIANWAVNYTNYHALCPRFESPSRRVFFFIHISNYLCLPSIVRGYTPEGKEPFVPKPSDVPKVSWSFHPPWVKNFLNQQTLDFS